MQTSLPDNRVTNPDDDALKQPVNLLLSLPRSLGGTSDQPSSPLVAGCRFSFRTICEPSHSACAPHQCALLFGVTRLDALWLWNLVPGQAAGPKFTRVNRFGEGSGPFDKGKHRIRYLLLTSHSQRQRYVWRGTFRSGTRAKGRMRTSRCA